ncbi:MAG: DNA adenine methylase [Candidatus Omnitrophota bacterium]|jgi:DNA adenine methylase|nr:MAG: DNA adenine methylase [Candidatus Omnitrophota bacterium]
MKKHILGASSLLRNKTILTYCDYREVVKIATPHDVIYMDPPYHGVSKKRDHRYIQGIVLEQFVEVLRSLNDKDISYIVSFDGRTGDKSHGISLPRELCLKHLEVEAGRSSQATLLGQDSKTFESLYLSCALRKRTGKLTNIIFYKSNQENLLFDI